MSAEGTNIRHEARLIAPHTPAINYRIDDPKEQKPPPLARQGEGKWHKPETGKRKRLVGAKVLFLPEKDEELRSNEGEEQDIGHGLVLAVVA